MRIKIKDPYRTQHHFAMLIWGVLACLALAAVGAAVYIAGGPLRAWQALGNTSNTFCEGDFICTFCFFALFKFAPFACVGFFIYSLWEKRTKYRSPRTGDYFTYMTFGPDGVLLEKPAPRKSMFFPYGETSLRVTVFAQLYHVKGTPRIHIGSLAFTFTQKNNSSTKANKPRTVNLLPPYRVLPFLCKILDMRHRFYSFSYDASTFSDQEASQIVLKKMDTYCENGFMSVFDCADHRTTCLWVGVTLAACAVWIFYTTEWEYFIKDGFVILLPMAAWFLWRPLKDAYLERRARRK